MWLRSIKRTGLALLLVLLLVLPAQAARLFTCGFEENSILTSMWSTATGNAATIVTTTPRHSGDYRLDTSASTGNSYITRQIVNKTSGTLFTRTYWHTNDETPSANAPLISFANGSLAVTETVSLLTTSVLRVTNVITATTVDGAVTIAPNTWYRIETSILLSDTVGVITVRLYDDTTPTATLLETIVNDGVAHTGEDTMTTNIGYVYIGKTASSAVFSYDDIAINDETGSVQTSWPGPGKVFLLVPDSDVSITWENEAAGAATFDKINDLPGTPDDVTTYNTEIVNLLSVDRFGLTNLGAEVPSDATINTVGVYGRVGSTQASATNLRFTLWDEASTLTNGPTVTAAVNGWRIVSTVEKLTYDPAGKTKANLDSFNVGYENITDVATRERRVTALWAEVEWSEFVAGGAVTPRGTLLGVYP